MPWARIVIRFVRDLKIGANAFAASHRAAANALLRRRCRTMHAEGHTARFQLHVSAAGPMVRDGHVVAAGVEVLPGRLSKRIREGCAHLFSVEQARVRKNLVQVRTMSGALLLDEIPPANLVQLREVRLVLRVDDVHGAALLHDDVRARQP